MDKTVQDTPLKNLPKSFLELVPNLVLYRGCQKNFSLDPTCSWHSESGSGTLQFLAFQFTLLQVAAPFGHLSASLYLCLCLGKARGTHLHISAACICEESIYPTVIQQLSLRSTDPHRQNLAPLSHLWTIYGPIPAAKADKLQIHPWTYCISPH